MKKLATTNFFILTGTPGTGKTSILNELRRRGYEGIDEPARLILKEQLKIDGPGLPSKSPITFIRFMLELSVKNYRASMAIEEPVFFDRGLPDLIAYALRFDVDPAQFKTAAEQYRYNATVFVLPPWKKIFVNDESRKLTFDESLLFHDEIVGAYNQLNYRLLELPLDSVSKRVDFLLESLPQSPIKNLSP